MILILKFVMIPPLLVLNKAVVSKFARVSNSLLLLLLLSILVSFRRRKGAGE